MSSIEVNTLLYSIVGSVIATLFISVVTFFIGRRFGRKKGNDEGVQKGMEIGADLERKKFEERYQSAIESFSTSLGSLITAAQNADKDKDLFSSARAIVSVRDSMRNQLTSISRLLNSDIDRLSNSLGNRKIKVLDEKTGKTSIQDAPIDFEDIRMQVDVLAKTWPTKGTQINVASRRLFAEFGLTENE